MDADHRKAATLIEAPVAMLVSREKLREANQQKAVTTPAIQEKGNPESASLAKAVDHRLARAGAAGHSDLQCEVDDLRSQVTGLALADIRGHKAAETGVTEKVVHHLAKVLPESDHHGCNAVSHLAVDHRSAPPAQDALRWGHRG